MQSEGMQSVQDLIDRLGGSGEVARAIGKPIGTVASWRHRNMLPVEIWPSIIELAGSKQDVPGVDAQRLLAMHATPLAAGAS